MFAQGKQVCVKIDLGRLPIQVRSPAWTQKSPHGAGVEMVMKQKSYRRAAVAWIVVRMITLGARGQDRLLGLASFLMRKNDIAVADLATLPGTLPLTRDAAAESNGNGQFVDEYVYRLARVLNRYERRAAAGIAGQPNAPVCLQVNEVQPPPLRT